MSDRIHTRLPCPSCDGHGWVHPMVNGDQEGPRSLCEECRGSGTIACTLCRSSSSRRAATVALRDERGRVEEYACDECAARWRALDEEQDRDQLARHLAHAQDLLAAARAS